MDLTCPSCGSTFVDRWRCTCGSPLDVTELPQPSTSAPDSATFDTREGLWSFSQFLPVGQDRADRVTFNEGMTPLVSASDWDASFKLEYIFPTGSFKDRGATTTLTRAVELGVERIVEDSSGNAGAAIATYAARAGIPAEIYVPATVKPAKLRAIERTGATPVRVEGDRSAVTTACISAVEDGSAWYASHAWNPAFFMGTATFALELALQRDWSVPDAVVMPLGHGTLFLGAYYGFSWLYEAGWTDRLPRLLGAQAAGVAPIVSAMHDETAAMPSDRKNNAADGIQIAQPVQRDAIMEAIDRTNGDVIAITEAETESARKRLDTAGFYVEPTSAVAPAAISAYRERGTIMPTDDIVAPLTGSGLKTA